MLNLKSIFNKSLSIPFFQKNLNPLKAALSTTSSNKSVYDPDYLNKDDDEIPNYDLLNVQIKGYDFSVLETYARYVHNTAERIGIDVENSWGLPCKKLKITKLQPESTIIDDEYLLNIYERNVQLADVPTTLLPIFLNIIEATLPAGTSLSVHPHFEQHTEMRYVPDLELKDLQSKLTELGGPSKK